MNLWGLVLLVSAASLLQLLGVHAECNTSALDIAFVMDESGSIGSTNYKRMKDLVHSTVETFNIGPDHVRVSMITYSSSARVRFHLNTHTTKASVLETIDNLPYARGATNTHKALDTVRNSVFTAENGVRLSSKGVPRIVIVITDGQSNSVSKTATAAALLHDEGYIVFGIGIKGAQLSELSDIASDEAYVYYISSFSQAQLQSLQVSISQRACIASSPLSITDAISDTMEGAKVKYVNYPLPSDGATLKLSVSTGKAALYVSTTVTTPNETFYESTITTSDYKDVYLDPSTLAGSATIYIAIVGLEASNAVILSASGGDSSTEPVKVTSLPTSVTGNYSGSVSITCVATGKPAPTITWYRNEEELHDTGTITITHTTVDDSTAQSSLTIDSLTYQDKGMYTCSATNSVTEEVSTSDSATLTLDLTLYVIDLTGSAVTSTAISLSWDIPSGPVVSQYNIECSNIATGDKHLLTVSEQMGVVISLTPHTSYGCRVAAVEGDTTHPFSTSTVTIQTNQAAPSAAPVDVSLSVVSPAVIELTWSQPPPQYHNGIIVSYTVSVAEITTDTSYTITTADNVTSLTVDSLHPYYSYTVKVAATTVEQGPYSDETSVTMPQDAPSSPPTDVSATGVNSTALTVSWQPIPADQLNGVLQQYHVALIEVDTEKSFEFSVTSDHLSISVTGLHPHYTYSVRVSGQTVDVSEYSEPVTVQLPEDVPTGPPNNFTGHVDSPTSAILSWTAPNLSQQNGLIVKYAISITEVKTGTSYFEYSTSKSLTLTLKPWRNYTIALAAETAVGTGPFTDNLELTTPQDAPSAAPVFTATTLLTSTSLQLNWNPIDVEDRNGIVTHYILSVTELETDDHQSFDSTTTHFLVEDLHPGYMYKCRVAASTTVGKGPQSDAYQVTTLEEAPSQVPLYFNASVISSRFITYSWSPPPPEYQNGVIISYRIKHTSSQGVTKHYTSADTNITITGLTPYNSYSCAVAAENSAGVGPYTDELSFTTEEDAPSSSPLIKSGSSVDARTVLLQWKPLPLQYHNGLLRQYWINITEEDTGESKIETVTDTVGVLVDLTPSFTYHFRVSAYTVAVGPYSDPIAVTMPQNAPSGSPRSISGHYSNSSTYSLQWDPPSLKQQGGLIEQYTIEITDVVKLKTVQYSAVSTHINITSMDPSVAYVCNIAAETASGQGPFSTAHVIKADSVEVLVSDVSCNNPPSSVEVTKVTDTSVRLTWTLVSYTIESYQVIYTQHSQSDEASQSIIEAVDSSINELILSNLVQETFYSFVVRAVLEDAVYSNNGTAILYLSQSTPTPVPTPVPVRGKNKRAVAIAAAAGGGGGGGGGAVEAGHKAVGGRSVLVASCVVGSAVLALATVTIIVVVTIRSQRKTENSLNALLLN